ncbi:MAG: RidA family protein [Chlamydiota bacterium]
MKTSISIINSSHAPAAIGPYSQAIEAGGFLFVSGQLPLDPKTGAFSSDDIHGQTEQVLENIYHILKEAGLTFDHVVKSEIYLKDIQDFAVVNKIYATRFEGNHKPARQTMQIGKLPLDARVEISCIAYKGHP